MAVRSKLILLAAFLGLLAMTALFYSYFLKNNSGKNIVVAKALASCREKAARAENILCFKRALENEVARSGMEPFLQAVEEKFLSDTSDFNSPTQCHDVLHAIGQIGGIYSKNIQETISQCSSTCTFGCFHGVIEGHLMKGLDIVKEIPQICQIDEDGSGKLKSACYHGLGHGLASVAGYELNKSLSFCDLIDEERYKIHCGSGVIMELYEPGSFGHALLEWPVDIPRFCDTLPHPYSMVCHTTAGLHEYGRSQDPQGAFRTCQSVPKEFINECNISIGRNFYYVFNGSAFEIVEACQNNYKDIFLNCIHGAIMASFAVERSSSHGLEICSLLGEKLETKCWEFLE